MIRSIHAIPYRPTRKSPPSVKLQIRSNNIISFLPAIKKEVALDEVFLGRELCQSTQPVKRKVPKGALAKFVHTLSAGPSRMFYRLRSAITKEKIVLVSIKSSYLKYKLCDDGWQWEEKGLGRLIGTEKKW